MSVKRFKFVSPGIFLNEVDNSFLPRTGLDVGPVIIGRTRRGPAMRPIRVESFSEFVETFGLPIPGPSPGPSADGWREPEAASGSCLVFNRGLYHGAYWSASRESQLYCRIEISKWVLCYGTWRRK